MPKPPYDGWVADLDLGDDHALSWTCWKPDRELNPGYADLPDVERLGALIPHGTCCGSVMFDEPATARLFPDHPKWKVESWEPLTLSPSILCRLCGDHGFIKQGKWIR